MANIKKIAQNAMMMTIFSFVIVVAFYGYQYYQLHIERSEWNHIACSTNIHDYENFMKKFPNGKFYNMAHTYYLDLKKQESDWHEIEHLDNVALFKEYINNNSSGKYVMQAKRTMDSLLWNIAVNDNDIPSYRRYMSELPEGEHYWDAKIRSDSLERNNLSDKEMEMCMHTISSFVSAITNRDETNLMMHVSRKVIVQGKTLGRDGLLAFMNHMYANDVCGLRWNVLDHEIDKKFDSSGNSIFETHFSADVHIVREDEAKIRYAVYEFVAVIDCNAKIVELNYKRVAAY